MSRIPRLVQKLVQKSVLAAPRVLDRLREDIGSARDNDPAARSDLEVTLTYPGLHALWMHRVAHALWKEGLPLAARLVSHTNRFITGIEVHPGAYIGRRVFIDHGMGVVIGETARIGDDCLIYKGVVLGGTTLEHKVRHPQVGSGVVIGSNACILGNIEIGDGARIGSGSVVVRPVPSGATVVGVPARIVVQGDRRARFAAALDHANLPDPVSDMLRALSAQNERLRARVEALEAKLDVDAPPASEAHDDPFEHEPLPRADGG